MANAFARFIDGNAVSWSVAVPVSPGSHTASETTLAGYTASAWGGDCAANGTVSVALGENKTCSITNDDQPGTLIVKKTLVGGTAAVTDFSYKINGGSSVQFEADASNSQTVNAGIYTVVEDAEAGYATTYNNCSNVMIPNGGTATCTITNYLGSVATNSELCVFDRDTSRSGQQFREIFTQDVQNFPSYKMTSTNPGQYFYNVFYSGTPGSTASFTITLPYPFVTQGAQPIIHAYSSVTTTTNSAGETCFVPGNGFFVNSQQVTLANYTNGTCANVLGGNSIGTTTFPVSVTVPPSGFVYLNMHLDYGLKGTAGYGNSNSNAVRFTSISTPPLVYLIPELADHTFSVVGVQTGSSTTENQNSFKRNPGVGGLVRTAVTQSSLGGATVTLKKGTTVVGTAITDEDGWYQIVYKHKARRLRSP